MNDKVLTPPEGIGPPNSLFFASFNTQADWERYVESLAKMLAINGPFDETIQAVLR